MEILTAEVERYRERYGRPGLVAEDVTLLKLLEAKHRREGFEQGLKQGLKQAAYEGVREGELRTQIRIVEGILDKGFSWVAIEAWTSVDAEGLKRLREELAALQADKGDGAP